MRLADVIQLSRDAQAGDWNLTPQTWEARKRAPDIVVRVENILPFGEDGVPLYGAQGDIIRLETEH